MWAVLHRASVPYSPSPPRISPETSVPLEAEAPQTPSSCLWPTLPSWTQTGFPGSLRVTSVASGLRPSMSAWEKYQGHCALGSIHLGPGPSRSLSQCPSRVLCHEASPHCDLCPTCWVARALGQQPASLCKPRPLGPRSLPSHPGGHCTKRPLQSLNGWMLGA